MERLSERQEQFIANAPLLYQGVIRDALEGAASPRRAIKAHCLSCSGFSRDEIRHCTVITCPLHRYRPYAIHDDEHDESKGE